MPSSAISSAVALCRERTGPVAAVSTWTGLAHLTAFVGATTVVSMPLGFVAVVPWRLVVAAMILITLAYFALADWLFMARLAGYVCIAEMPEALPVTIPALPAHTSPSGSQEPPVESTIDRDDLILSDDPPARLAVDRRLSASSLQNSVHEVRFRQSRGMHFVSHPKNRQKLMISGFHFSASM